MTLAVEYLPGVEIPKPMIFAPDVGGLETGLLADMREPTAKLRRRPCSTLGTYRDSLEALVFSSQLHVRGLSTGSRGVRSSLLWIELLLLRF